VEVFALGVHVSLREPWSLVYTVSLTVSAHRRPSTEDAVVEFAEFNSRTCVYMYSVKSDKMCEVEVAATSRQRHADRSKARVARHYNRVWRAGRIPLRWHVDIGEKQAKTNKSKSKTL